MTVIEIGDMQMMDGAKFPGIVIQATRGELQAVAGNILYKEVVVLPTGEKKVPSGKNSTFWDVKFDEMVSALIAVDALVREAKPSRTFTRAEVLAMLDKIDPGKKGNKS